MKEWSYADTYVAACGQPFSWYSLGVKHERECVVCQTAILYPDGEECELSDQEQVDD